MKALYVSSNNWTKTIGGDSKDSKKTEKPDGVVAKKKDAEVQTIKLKEAKGKDRVDWSNEDGGKEKTRNIPNFAMSFA